MAKVTIEVDTEEKTAVVKLDGETIDNISSVSVNVPDKDDAYACSCNMIYIGTREELSEGVKKMSTIYASEHIKISKHTDGFQNIVANDGDIKNINKFLLSKGL